MGSIPFAKTGVQINNGFAALDLSESISVSM
jgi:hypothetical protein